MSMTYAEMWRQQILSQMYAPPPEKVRRETLTFEEAWKKYPERRREIMRQMVASDYEAAMRMQKVTLEEAWKLYPERRPEIMKQMVQYDIETAQKMRHISIEEAWHRYPEKRPKLMRQMVAYDVEAALYGPPALWSPTYGWEAYEKAVKLEPGYEWHWAYGPALEYKEYKEAYAKWYEKASKIRGSPWRLEQALLTAPKVILPPEFSYRIIPYVPRQEPTRIRLEKPKPKLEPYPELGYEIRPYVPGKEPTPIQLRPPTEEELKPVTWQLGQWLKSKVGPPKEIAHLLPKKHEPGIIGVVGIVGSVEAFWRPEVPTLYSAITPKGRAKLEEWEREFPGYKGGLLFGEIAQFYVASKVTAKAIEIGKELRLQEKIGYLTHPEWLRYGSPFEPSYYMEPAYKRLPEYKIKPKYYEPAPYEIRREPLSISKQRSLWRQYEKQLKEYRMFKRLEIEPLKEKAFQVLQYDPTKGEWIYRTYGYKEAFAKETYPWVEPIWKTGKKGVSQAQALVQLQVPKTVIQPTPFQVTLQKAIETPLKAQQFMVERAALGLTEIMMGQQKIRVKVKRQEKTMERTVAQVTQVTEPKVTVPDLVKYTGVAYPFLKMPELLRFKPIVKKKEKREAIVGVKGISKQIEKLIQVPTQLEKQVIRQAQELRLKQITQLTLAPQMVRPTPQKSHIPPIPRITWPREEPKRRRRKVKGLRGEWFLREHPIPTHRQIARGFGLKVSNRKRRGKKRLPKLF